jgi:methylmalonyl-CoA/ethylmalonyl-CoA epimerase
MKNTGRTKVAELREVLKDHILGVAHVGFVVADLAVAVADARRVYGLEPDDFSYQPAAGEEAQTRFAFFRVGDLEFELIEPRSEHFRALLLNMPSGGGGINHVAWRVVDIDGAVALLARQGIVPGHVTPNGVINLGPKKMLYLDPATTGGLVIELIETLADTHSA